MDVAYLGNILEILLVGKVGIQRDGSRLDSDTTLLFVLSCVRKPAIEVSLCTLV